MQDSTISISFTAYRIWSTVWLTLYLRSWEKFKLSFPKMLKGISSKISSRNSSLMVSRRTNIQKRRKTL